MSDNELAYAGKEQTAVFEKASSQSSCVGFDDKATKRLLRKIDLALIPLLSILYLQVASKFKSRRRWHSHSLSFLDRSNIGNAKLAGIQKSLHLKGLDYNVCHFIRKYIHANENSECTGHLFSLLCPSWSAVQPNDETHTAFHLDPFDHGSMGVCGANDPNICAVS